jgi:hypothetical protein
MSEKIYPEGVIAFSPRSGAPDFVKGSIIITPNDLISWLKKNENLLTEYDGKKQLKLQLLNGKKGLYLSVDTYKKEETSLPF